jgi:hypothetical protein
MGKLAAPASGPLLAPLSGDAVFACGCPLKRQHLLFFLQLCVIITTPPMTQAIKGF